MCLPLSRPGAPTGSTDDRWIGGVASGVARHRPSGALGADRPRRADRLRWLRALCCTPDCAAGPTTRTRSPRDWPPPPGREARRAPEGRLADYGPLVAVGAIAIGVLLAVTMATGQTLALGCSCSPAPSLPAAGRRGAAPALARPVAAHGPDQGHRRRRRMAGLPPHRCRPPAPVAAITLFSLRWGSLSVALNVGLAAAFGSTTSASASWWGHGCSASPPTSARSARRGSGSEERADVAAHLHDSVLQTLALIQRSAGDATTVPPRARAGTRPAFLAVRGGRPG